MKKKFALSILLLFIITMANAQEKDSNYLRYNYYGFGILNNAYQESKFSDMQYRGFGLSITLFGWYKQKNKNTYEFNSKLGITILKSTTNSVTKIINPEYNLNFSYLRTLKQRNNFSFKVGGEWNNDFTFKVQDYYYFFGNTISLKLETARILDEENKITINLNIGLIGLIKELHSFSFLAPQDYIDNGEFDYADKSKIINPLCFNKIEFFGKYNRLKSEIAWHYKKWIFSYEWNLLNTTTMKNYPTTNASHNLKFIRKFNMR